MESKKDEQKPVEQTPAIPPGSGDATPAPEKDKDGNEIKVVSADKGIGFNRQSHATPSYGGPVKKKKSAFARPIIMGPLALILVAGLGVGTVLFLKKPVSKVIQDTTGINLQSLGGDQLGKIQAGAAGNPNQTLTINPPTNFKNGATIGGALTVQGATTSKGIINALGGLNVSGAVTFDTITSRGGINVAGSSNLQGDVNINSLLTVRQSLNVLGSGNIGGGLSVGGSLSVTGALTAASLQLRDFTVTNSFTVEAHIVTAGDKPTIAAETAFAGSGATASVEGNDVTGTIIINTGNGPAIGNLATLTFRKSYGSVPKVLLTPVGSSSSTLRYYTAKTPANFVFFTSNAPLANTTYSYDYFVIQ